MNGFNTRYAIARLQGVIAMLEDAENVEQAGHALIHLSQVTWETTAAAKATGLLSEAGCVMSEAA